MSSAAIGGDHRERLLAQCQRLLEAALSARNTNIVVERVGQTLAILADDGERSASARSTIGSLDRTRRR